jgi:hypothetical protein
MSWYSFELGVVGPSVVFHRYLRVDLQSLLEVKRKDYSDLFSTVEHEIECGCGQVPPASVRLHFIRHDAGGLVPMDKLVDTLISYITHFCFTSERRADLSEQARNRAYLEAKRLFRDNPNSGQPGELLVYFLIEAVLQAPQVLKKMPITTNPNDERKGSDGVHVRWTANGELLEVIFAEAKLHKDFAAALTSAFKSMTDFHNSATKNLEINYFLNAFSFLSQKQRDVIASYVEGENKGKCQEVHVCLIGYTWKEYGHLKTAEKEKFLAEFEKRYLAWASAEMKPKLNAELAAFTHSHLKFEFFFLPFVSVENVRTLFLDTL